VWGGGWWGGRGGGGGDAVRTPMMCRSRNAPRCSGSRQRMPTYAESWSSQQRARAQTPASAMWWWWRVRSVRPPPTKWQVVVAAGVVAVVGAAGSGARVVGVVGSTTVTRQFSLTVPCLIRTGGNTPRVCRTGHQPRRDWRLMHTSGPRIITGITTKAQRVIVC